MKLDKKQTDEYIKLELPIVKGELRQANNRINTLITVFGIYLTLLVGLLVFFGLKVGDGYFYIVIICVLSLLLLFGLLKIRFAIRSLKPFKNIKDKNQVKKINIFNFFEIAQVSSESFLSNFTVIEQNKNALLQVHINAKIAEERYKAASHLMSWKVSL